MSIRRTLSGADYTSNSGEVKPTITKLLESEIQGVILQFLRLKGIWCWRQNTMGFYDTKLRKYRTAGKFSIKGVPDILGILPDGKFLGIEVKRPKSKRNLSSDQLRFQKEILDRKGICFVATCLEDVQMALKPYFDLMNRYGIKEPVIVEE